MSVGNFYDTHSNTVFGTEAINFQVSSNLGKKLTALFQEVIDYRDSLEYPHIPEVLDQSLQRCEDVPKFFKKNIDDRLKSIISSETGLKVKKMNLIYGTDYGVIGLFAVDLSFEDWRVSVESMERMTGTGSTRYTNDREAIDEFTSMADSLNLKTGKLTKPTFGKNKQISVNMWFDINCAFLTTDFYPEKTMPPMQAEEIAAIVMHEIGHALSVAEHSADLFATRQRMTNFLQQPASPTESINRLKYMKEKLVPALSKLQIDSGDANSNKRLNALKNNVCHAINNLLSLYEAEPEEESWAFTIGSVVVNVIYSIMILINTIITSFIFLALALPVLMEMAKYLSYSDSGTTGVKHSDVSANYTQSYLIERWADEFVSRHGYGDQLASGLNKIHMYFKYSPLGPVFSARLRKSTLFNWYCISFGWLIDKINVLTYLDPIGYEVQYDRVVRLRQNAYAFFKKADVPPATADTWIKSIENLDKQIIMAKTASDTKIMKAAVNTINNLVNPVRWYQMLKDGKLDSDMELLINRTDDLINNPLFYQAARLNNRR